MAERDFPNKDRFDKFTERTRRVLACAQEEAQRLSEGFIDTEHLLLGLTLEKDGLSAKVIANLGGDVSKIRETVARLMIDRQPTSDLGLTKGAKRAIELATDEARTLNHYYIGTEHLLLGLSREGEGIAARALQSLDLTTDKLSAETTRILSQFGSSGLHGRFQYRRPPLPAYFTETEEGKDAFQAVVNWRLFFDNLLVGKQLKDKYTGELSELLKKAQEEHNNPENPSTTPSL